MSVYRTIELGLLQMQVLWILSKQPLHGYKLMELLNGIKRTKVTQGTLYPVLAKLEALRFIKAGKEGARGKKTYHLTVSGKRVAAQSCREFVSIYQSIFYDFCCSSCSGQGSVAKPVQFSR